MTRKLLIVTASHFVAGAVYEKRGNLWRCVDAAPIVFWLMSTPPKQAADIFRRRGWTWEWRKESEGHNDKECISSLRQRAE